MTRKEFAKGFLVLKRSLPKVQADEETAFFVLGTLPAKDFFDAILNVVRDKNFKLYDNVLGEIWDRANNKNNITAECAWEKVSALIRSEGYFGDCRKLSDDKKIERAIESNGGWHHFCISDEVWSKKAFIKTYEDFQDSEESLIRQGQLEHDNKICLPKEVMESIGNMP